MNHKSLLEKIDLLLAENATLLQENKRLNALLAMGYSDRHETVQTQDPPEKRSPVKSGDSDNTAFEINRSSDSIQKIRLFKSLFKGREDVYAMRWENKIKETSGYSPVCLNQWKPGLCNKPKVSCTRCDHRKYASLDESVIENHLKGNVVAGIYPMLPDETCWFLAMDFDKAQWQEDISTVRDACIEFDIPVAIERSRSGKGGHAWFFFENPIAAPMARKLGTALLTFAMNRRHEIRFKSYDRLFPSQDTLPAGGFGNLIALPLQKSARINRNSEFVDENFAAHEDQWAFLSSLKRIPENRVERLISELCPGSELGILKIDEEDPQKPWEPQKLILVKKDFPDQIQMVRANMLYIPKAGISQRALNRIKRLASFKNPDFYKRQAMRLSTHKNNRIISCADETTEYLCLPRGCEPDFVEILDGLGVDVKVLDQTFHGKSIDVSFKGLLRDEQIPAIDQLLLHDAGILSGTTAFGKTVVAIKLIAERKVNTLILVDKVSLLDQWKEKLAQFLEIKETLPEIAPVDERKRKRKKKTNVIGELGAGKNILTGIVDVALMQSLGGRGEVKDCVRNYGMIIADECHHASAFTYEKILKTAGARYVYGLSATPTRKDGHHPILFMQCGPIRYRDNPKQQAKKRPFDHFIIPRFTSLRIPPDQEKEFSIQDWYAEMTENEFRNRQIVDDVLSCHAEGRNCLVLSLRTAHVEKLAKTLMEETGDVEVLIGGMGRKKTREAFKRISDPEPGKNIILVATGSFIGEGFDDPRLDTLFLAMPISWKGTLQQYAGRLHRLFEDKKEVRIYDYVDIHVKMLERMYQKRLSGYAAMGYMVKGGELAFASPEIIFDNDNFLQVFRQDILSAKKEILIVSPFVRQKRCGKMLEILKPVLGKNIPVKVITRPKEDHKPEDRDALGKSLDLLKTSGVELSYQPHIHQKFAIIDQKIVWYGSINLLSYGTARESIMRLESANIAYALMKI